MDIKNNLVCLVLLLAFWLTRNCCECQRGSSNIRYSHSIHQNQNVHRRERFNSLTNQVRPSADSVSNYRRYATKLTNPCGNAQRSIMKRASQSSHEENTVNLFLNLAKQNRLPQNSLDLILSLAGVAKKLVENQNKAEVRNDLNEKERNRRETELDMGQFVQRRTELRNLLSGLQTMIIQHILLVTIFNDFLISN